MMPSLIAKLLCWLICFTKWGESLKKSASFSAKNSLKFTSCGAKFCTNSLVRLFSSL